MQNLYYLYQTIHLRLNISNLYFIHIPFGRLEEKVIKIKLSEMMERERQRELTAMRSTGDIKMAPSRPTKETEKTMKPPTSRKVELVRLELPVITSSRPSLTTTPRTPNANSMTPRT